VAPGQQVLDIQPKLITHGIGFGAFDTATTLARAVRVHTGYARAKHTPSSGKFRQRRHRPQ
jgi:hypothetical protein